MFRILLALLAPDFGLADNRTSSKSQSRSLQLQWKARTLKAFSKGQVAVLQAGLVRLI